MRVFAESDIRTEDGRVVWRMTPEVAEFYAAEIDGVNQNRTDVGMSDDASALWEAAERLAPDESLADAGATG